MNATLSKLRQTEIIQCHHWKAAQWLAAIPRNDPVILAIAEGCRDIDARSNKFSRKLRADPFGLVMTACTKPDVFDTGEMSIGVLREGLNVVHREMCRERKTI